MLKFKLNDGNPINAINIWALATARCGTGIINWNKGELDKIDRQTVLKIELERSNLLDYAANNNDRLLKAASVRYNKEQRLKGR